MTVFHTAALGWTAGQSAATTGSLLASFLSTNRANDTLVLDAQYSISGGPYQFPDDFTMEAVYGGGFTCTDPSNSANLLRFGNRTRLINARIGFTGAPTSGQTSKRLLLLDNKTDCEIRYCHIGGNVTGAITAANCGTSTGHVDQLMEIRRGSGHRFHGTGWRGGRWAININPGTSGTSNVTFSECRHYNTNSDGDALKTTYNSGGSPGCSNFTFRMCVFEDLGRDGIDTTGGLKDSLIEDCIFRRMFWCGLDLKSQFYNSADLGKMLNQNIIVRRCDFSDCRAGAVVMTTEDRAFSEGSGAVLTTGNAQANAVGKVRLEDCIVEGRGSSNNTLRVFFSKGAYNTAPYNWSNLTVLGTVGSLVSYDSPGANMSAAVLAVLNFGFTGPTPTTGSARANSTAIPFTYGPQAIVPPEEEDPPVEYAPLRASAIVFDPNAKRVITQTGFTGTFPEAELTLALRGPGGTTTAPWKLTVEPAE